MHKLARISFKLLDLLVIFLLTFGSPMTVLADPSPTGATITTQLPDYPPGALVLMTGAGWVENEGVHIVVNADDQSWTLESNPDPIADGNGGFTYEFQLPNWFVASYTVSATGFTSGTATVTFTDLAVGTYDQCSNDDGDGYASGDTGCRWINGNLQSNNSRYSEGDATVQRVWLTDFVPGSTHTLTLQYGTTKGGKHSYDFLTTWDWSEDWILETDRCQDITGCVGLPESKLDIPQDPNVPDPFEPSAPGDRQFTMRGGTLNSSTTPSIESGSYAGDSETIITISFTVANSGTMCSDGLCDVALWFGAHVAAQANWGLDQGAGSIPGSPYHVALYRVDGASVGQRDNQMQANAVTAIPNGTIVIVKDAVPNDAQDFTFNLNNNSTISQNFSLDDDADGTLPNSQTFSVPPGTWTASELNIPSGWSLSNLTCSVAGTNGSTFIVSGATATITLKSGTTSGDTVTCTYTDTRNTGSLTLSKTLSGGPAGYTGPFTIAYDCDGTAYDGSVSISADGSQTVSGIPSGTSCTVSETPPTAPTGYTFGTPTFSPSNTVLIGQGTTVTVTTNNTLTRDQGYLKISKAFDPKTSGFNDTFAIVYNCGAGDQTVNLAGGASTTVGPFDTGTSCSVSEPTLPTAPAGWTFGTPVVTGSPATITAGDQAAAVLVSVSNSITRDQGYFKITKSFDPQTSGFTGKFDIVYNCGAGNVTVQLGAGESQTFGPFDTGTSCSVSEPTLPTAPTGWTFGTPVVTGSPATIVKGDQAAAVEVTVTNSITRDRGNFKITKSTSNPDGATLPAAFTGTYDCGVGYTGNFSVANGASQTVSGIPTGNTCTVTETAPDPIPGFTWGTITYTPASIVISDKGETFEIVVGNSITRDLGNFKISKTTSNPDGATLPSAFTGTYDCGVGYTGTWSVATGGSQTVTGIPTGNSCSVTEDALAPISGYTWGTPTFTPASITIDTKGGTFEIAVGNSITRDRGGLEITKSTFNPDGVTLPSFVMNYDCGLDTNGSALTGSKTIASGGSAIVGGIPTGNICSVTEVAPTAIQDYTWADPTYTPASIVISKKAVFLIEVHNSITRDRGSFKITKSTFNPDGATLPDAFTGTYDCGTFSGGKYSEFKGTFSVADGGSQTISGIPTGNTCSVVETAPAPIAGYTWGPISYTPPTITIGAKDGTFEIVVGNSITRDRGSLVLAKNLSGGPGGYTGPFTINYDCGTGYVGSVTVNSGSSQTVSGIPTGTSCTVSETVPTPPTGYSFGSPTFSPSATVVIPSGNGSSVTVTTNNTLTRDTGSLKIIKTVSGGSFSGTFNVKVECTGDGGTYNRSITYPTTGFVTITGIPTGNTCTVTEPTFPAPPAGYVWGTPTITGSPAAIGKDTIVEVTVANTLKTGHARVVKTVGGQPVSATNNCMDVSGNMVGCTFQLRQGASTTVAGTTLETLSTLNGTTPVGTLNFTTLLTPGQTYQMCEVLMPGWLTSLGTFVPNSFLPPDGVATNPAVDNSILCGNFVAQADTTTDVGNIFTIDNTPPPGGRGLTIGFWKNWASCTASSTSKMPILDQTLAKASVIGDTTHTGHSTLPGIVISATSGTYSQFGSTYYLVIHGSTTAKNLAPDCQIAVRLLDKSTIDTNKKMASDPAFNLAAQLVAAELNYAAGAGKKPSVTTAIQQAVLLLGKYKFDGKTHTKISTADATTMNNLAKLLDNYNNNRP